MKEILDYLKANGECIDSEIAKAVGLSLPNTLVQLAELAAKREIMAYQSTSFENGKKVEGMKCRVTGFLPKAAPGRKSGKVQLKLS